MKTKNSKKVIGIIIALACVLVFSMLPGSENGLSHQAYGAIGIFLAAIVMWMLDSLPMSLVGCLAIECLLIYHQLLLFRYM